MSARGDRKLVIPWQGMVFAAAAVLWAHAASLAEERPASPDASPWQRLVRSEIEGLFAGSPGLRLTEDQKARVRAIVEHRAPEFEPLLKRIVACRRQLRLAVLADTPDEAAIRKAATELGEATGDASVKMAAVTREVRALLTPEQIQQLRASTAEREKPIERWLDGAPPAAQP